MARRRAGSPPALGVGDWTRGAAGGWDPAANRAGTGSDRGPPRETGPGSASRGGRGRTRARGRVGDPARKERRWRRQASPPRPRPPRTRVVSRRFPVEARRGGEIDLGSVRLTRVAVIEDIGQRWIGRGRFEGRGCDTVLFGDRVRIPFAGCQGRNRPLDMGSCLRRIVGIRLRRCGRLGRRSRARRLIRRRMGLRRCLRRRRKRFCGRARWGTSVRDRLGRGLIGDREAAVGPDELAGADPDPGHGRGVRDRLDGRSNRLAGPGSAPPGLAAAGAGQAGVGIGRRRRDHPAGRDDRVGLAGGEEGIRPSVAIRSRIPAELGVVHAGAIHPRFPGRPGRRAPGTGEDHDHQRQVGRHQPDRDEGHRPRGQTHQRGQARARQDGPEPAPCGAGRDGRTRSERGRHAEAGPNQPGQRPGPCVGGARRRGQGSILPAAREAVMAGPLGGACPVDPTGPAAPGRNHRRGKPTARAQRKTSPSCLSYRSDPPADSGFPHQGRSRESGLRASRGAPENPTFASHRVIRRRPCGSRPRGLGLPGASAPPGPAPCAPPPGRSGPCPPVHPGGRWGRHPDG